MRAALVVALLLVAQVWAESSLHGTVTDPSGAAVPNAAVEIDAHGGGKRVRTDNAGQYWFARVTPGKYALKVTRFAKAPVMSAGVMIANII